MSRNRLYVATLLLLSPLAILTGCFSTTIEPLAYSSEAYRLLATSDVPLALRLHSPDPELVVGHQFVMLAAPLTRIYTPHIARELATHLALEGAKHRYRIIPASEVGPETAPLLSVTVTQLSLSGYDLIFVRRPSASITLTATLEAPDRLNRACQASAEVTKTRQFAFSPQLSDVLQATLADATTRLFKCLGL